jgi:hypothetical protein
MNALERRYRRLLALYPRSHRAIHEAEMLDVLLDTAAQGQRWPGTREIIDLLHGALLIWLHQMQRAVRDGWADALAIVATLAPILLCLVSVPAAGFLLRAVLEPTVSMLSYPLLAGAVVAWPLIFTLSLLRQHRLAALTGWVTTAASSSAVLFQGQELLVLELLAAFALTFSPGVPRGLTLLGPARVLSFSAGILLVSAYLAERFAEDLSPDWATAPVLVCFALGWVLIGRTAFQLQQPANRRAAILLALPVTAIAMSQLSLTPVVSQPVFHVAYLLLPLAVFGVLIAAERAAVIRRR